MGGELRDWITGLFHEWQLQAATAGRLLAAGGLLLLSALLLPGCADEGAGDYEELKGDWSGSFSTGGIPFSTAFRPLAHPSSGTAILTITKDDPDDIQGTISLTPDICDDSISVLGETVTGTFINGIPTFRYTSISGSFPGDVIFSVLLLGDPMLGEFDANDCGSGWTGGFKLDLQ